MEFSTFIWVAVGLVIAFKILEDNIERLPNTIINISRGWALTLLEKILGWSMMSSINLVNINTNKTLTISGIISS